MHKFHSQTLAKGYNGFPPILSNMLTQALGCNTTPVYLVFQSEPVPHLCRYEAKVLLRPGPARDRKPLVFKGKPMPTTALAVQTAATEAITRLLPVSASSGDEGVPLFSRFVQ